MPGPDSVSSVLLLYVKGELGLPLMIRAEVGYRLQGKKETLSHTALFLLVVVEFITIYFSGAPLLLLQVDKTSLY